MDTLLHDHLHVNIEVYEECLKAERSQRLLHKTCTKLVLWTVSQFPMYSEVLYAYA